MEDIKFILPYIQPLLIFLSGIISSVLFYKFKVRTKDVQVTKEEFTTVKQISDEYLSTIKDMSDQITELHEKLILLNQKLKRLIVENSSKDLEIATLQRIVEEREKEIESLVNQIDTLVNRLQANSQYVYLTTSSLFSR